MQIKQVDLQFKNLVKNSG